MKDIAMGVALLFSGLVLGVLAERYLADSCITRVYTVPLHNKADLHQIVWRDRIYFLTEAPVYLDKNKQGRTQ